MEPLASWEVDYPTWKMRQRCVISKHQYAIKLVVQRECCLLTAAASFQVCTAMSHTHTHSDTKTAAVIFSLLSERKWETKYTDTQFVLRRFIYPVTELENALTFSGRAN